MPHHPIRRPWAFAAVCVMVPALTLLVFNLTWVPVNELLPGYMVAYLLIGACVFGPAGRIPSLRQAVAFLLPGVLLVVPALLGFGLWCGGWLLGLPAWGALLSRWTPDAPLPAGQVLRFFGLLGLGMVIFTMNIMWVVFSLTVFLLPVIPFIRLAYPAYRASPRQAAVEILLAVSAVAVAVTLPTPASAWSAPWMYAGGAATAGLMLICGVNGVPRKSARPRLGSGAVL